MKKENRKMDCHNRINQRVYILQNKDSFDLVCDMFDEPKTIYHQFLMYGVERYGYLAKI